MITLNEAIERKAIIIHETGNVEELFVENKGDVHVFIQAGDIIKGGRQDRILVMCWSEVAVMQKQLGSKLGKSVKSNESSSSLQLSLENKELEKKSKEYIQALQNIPEGQQDVIGFALT